MRSASFGFAVYIALCVVGFKFFSQKVVCAATLSLLSMRCKASDASYGGHKYKGSFIVATGSDRACDAEIRDTLQRDQKA